MLKYIKEVILDKVNKEIDATLEQFTIKTAEVCKLEEEKKYIDSYLAILRDQKDCVLNVVFWTALAIVCGALGTGAGIGIAFRVLMYIFFLIVVNQGFKYFGIKNQRKKEYNDIYKISKGELLEKSEELGVEISKVNALIDELFQSIWDKSAYLTEVSKYDNLHREFHNSVQTEEPTLFEEFLDEKVDTADVHFDNGLTNPIEYTPESKHYTKKLA
ncbi:MAG: hypothetical protein J1F35_00540 [Erysipelotrichales bacterium]|nr:hypothetical protein [Erysipelotrichales bacterium]